MRAAFHSLVLSDHLRLYSPPLLLAQIIKADMRRDAEQPGPELRFATETGQSAETPKKHFLRQVFCVFPPSHHPVDEREKRFAPTREKDLKGVCIPRLRSRDDCSILLLGFVRRFVDEHSLSRIQLLSPSNLIVGANAGPIGGDSRTGHESSQYARCPVSRKRPHRT